MHARTRVLSAATLALGQNPAGFYIAIERNVDVKKLVGIKGEIAGQQA